MNREALFLYLNLNFKFMPYAKILRWQKLNIDNPLPCQLVVACVHELKADPLQYYSPKWEVCTRESFVEACANHNMYSGKTEVDNEVDNDIEIPF